MRNTHAYARNLPSRFTHHLPKRFCQAIAHSTPARISVTSFTRWSVTPMAFFRMPVIHVPSTAARGKMATVTAKPEKAGTKPMTLMSMVITTQIYLDEESKGLEGIEMFVAWPSHAHVRVSLIYGSSMMYHPPALLAWNGPLQIMWTYCGSCHLGGANQGRE